MYRHLIEPTQSVILGPAPGIHTVALNDNVKLSLA